VLLSTDNCRVAQWEGIEWIDARPRALLGSQMGIGKTGVILLKLSELVEQGYRGKCLVIAPKAVAQMTWPDARDEWAFSWHLTMTFLRDEEDKLNAEDFTHVWRVKYWVKKNDAMRKKLVEIRARELEWELRSLNNIFSMAPIEEVRVQYDKLMEEYARLRTERTKIREQLRQGKQALKYGLRSIGATGDIHLINWHNVHWLVHFWGNFWPYKVVVYDESDIGLKGGRNALVWRAMNIIRPHTEYFWELAGTPRPESLENLWGQIYILDGGKRLGPDITDFRKNFMVSDYKGYSWTERPGAMEEVMKRISDIVIIQRTRDYMDCPPEISYNVPVVLDEAAFAAYKEMEREFILDLPEGEIIADNAAVLIQKLLQLANGRVKDKDKKLHEVHSAKLDAIADYLERREGENVLIAPWFDADVTAILKRFKKFEILTADKPDVKKRWNEGKIRGMLLHPGADAHGLNIQYGGRRVLWFGPIFSNGKYQQLNERLAGARSVGLGSTFIDHLIAQGTADVYWIEKLQGKAANEQAALTYITQLRQDYSTRWV
jgi:hypothetical protein